jgi:hypothetical protein
VFLPTKDGALNGFMKPMLGLDLVEIYNWTNASLDVVSTGDAFRLYFWQSRARQSPERGLALSRDFLSTSSRQTSPNPYPLRRDIHAEMGIFSLDMGLNGLFKIFRSSCVTVTYYWCQRYTDICMARAIQILVFVRAKLLSQRTVFFTTLW